MYCSQCGAKVNPNTKYCGNCGAPIEKRDEYNTFNNYDNNMTYSQNNGLEPAVEEKVGLGLAITSLVFAFIFPVVGLILGIIAIRKANGNKNSKVIGTIGFVLSLIQIIFLVVIAVLVLLLVAFTESWETNTYPNTNTFASQAKCEAAISCKDNYDDTMSCIYYNTSDLPEEILCKYDESKLDEFKNVQDDDFDYDLNDDDLDMEEEI